MARPQQFAIGWPCSTTTWLKPPSLDVNLADGDITPVVERLLAMGAQIIFQTGTGLPPEMAARFPGLAVQMKPNMPEKLVGQLAEMLRIKQTAAVLIK